MTIWQPIETAPKDGTNILVFDLSGGDAFVVEARYCVDQYGERWRYVDTVLYYEYPLGPTFAFWVPLPEPPK
ncbi:hypothetical protein LG047_15175 [Methylocystis sp. WRRC1]|uniref:hypothetical protein n=1 Tax=Methylocystis sp. WRRC1 TaxID=1732014 RepID=UPI001D159A06|nr:hypothetical protein [Methylocystis sp. WRRC1]MCC3246642.1 hypothetical protein [Methylocystis sp. WRRC1]